MVMLPRFFFTSSFAVIAAGSYSSLSSGAIRATPLALVGQTAPGQGPLTFGNFYVTWSIDSNGAVVFSAALDGPNITPGDQNSIWYGRPGSLGMVARDNDP